MKTRFKMKVDDTRMGWERTRIQAFYSAVAAGISAKTIKDFMPFEWDSETAPSKKQVEVLTREESEKRLKEIKYI